MRTDHLADGMNEYLPLRDVVFKTLRNAIITGELIPGERLLEISLAKRLGVSRTPVREAIRKLELEGLVVMIPRRGAHVASISRKGLCEVMEVRNVLEEFAAQLACDRIRQEEMDAMESAHAQFIHAIQSDDLLRIVECDEKFHDAIFQAAGNERLLSIIAGLREQFYRYRMEYIRDMDDYSILVREHEDLMNAIFHHDKDTAKEIMNTHIRNQQELVARMIPE